MNSSMIKTGGDTKNPFAVRNAEITILFTCRKPLAQHDDMVEEEEETLAAVAFIGSFTSVQPGFRLRLLLIANYNHYSSMSAHYCHLGANQSAAQRLPMRHEPTLRFLSRFSRLLRNVAKLSFHG